MKNIKILFVAFLLVLASNNVLAQRPAIAPNFGLTDSTGQTHFLHEDILDQGKTAVLIIFSVTCQSCWENVPNANNWYTTHGENQEDVVIWGIEISEATDYNAVGDFASDYGTLYPLFNLNEQDSVCDLMNITYTPYYFVICSDGSYRNFDVNDVPQAIGSCLEMVGVDDESVPEPELFVQNQQLLLRQGSIDDYQLTVFSLDGRVVKKALIRKNEALSLSVPSGMYIYQLKNQKTESIFTGRLLF
ncbi:MAG: T9SS type A sorting domain-containing protein [Bacteroidota bacterium]|nr:T9SS type A sorting domain-containing protein [Bacteroidota bacterium]